MKKNLNTGFSLIEALIAFLLVSVTLAALAPVMTKRLINNTYIKDKDTDLTKPEYIDCYSYTSAKPTVNVTLNDVYFANFIIASGGGGGAGATSETVVNNQTYLTQSMSSANSVNNTLRITEDIDEVKIDFMTGGGGGGGGGAVVKSGVVPTVSSCSTYGNGKTDTAGNTGANFATYDSYNNFCITKFNQTSGTNCYSGYKNNCNSSSKTAYVYSGCGRTVCTFAAAQNACNTLASKTGDSWRLPTPNELSKWTDKTAWQAFALCDHEDEDGAFYVSACKRSVSAVVYPSYYAWPNHIWTSTAGTLYEYRGDRWTLTGGDVANLYSTRCVLAATTIFYSVSGGGGGASPSINSSNAISNELNTIIKQNVNGSVEITAGGGGTGGAKASAAQAKGANGTNGNDSCIRVRNSADTVVYKICTVGGKYGLGGDGSGTGTGGSAQAATDINSGCYKQYSETGAKTFFSCTSAGKAGTAGTSSTSSPASGGYGGVSSFPNASTTGAYYVSNTTGATLADATNPGSGGGAGRSITTSDTTGYSIGPGGRGTGGYVKLTYKRKYPGSGGGGGGAGSVARIAGIPVGQTSVCTFNIGKGGAGGAVNSNGADGGLSSVKCTTDSRTFTVNGGTGGKIGTSAQSVGAKPAGGISGKLGDITQSIFSVEPEKRIAKKGTDGTNANISIGGKGGTSGTGTKGGCGGMYTESGICQVNQSDANRITGKGYTYTDIIKPTADSIVSKTYGSAGAGGGGGAWVRNVGSGKGGDGLGGYVCVFWYKEKE